MSSKKLFFIYVAKNSEWNKLYKEDWAYVSSMTRFFHWWIKRFFNIDFSLEADILPVIPGKIFDRMSLAYLLRDHKERGQSVYHFYLTYFKIFWTDCNIDGYSSDNLGAIRWRRPDTTVSEEQKIKFFADSNCARISHILLHEILRMNGKKKKDYFDKVHDVWDEHELKNMPFVYYNDQFSKVSSDSKYKFVTMNISNI